MRLATGPVSWGVDFAGVPGNPPWRAVLEGIAAAGFTQMELGPLGYLPPEADEVLAALGLSVTAGFVFEPLDAPQTRDVAARVCERVAALGGTFLVLIDAVAPPRERTAGDLAAAPRGDFAPVGAAIGELAEIGRAHGLRPLVHPHAGTRVEFADEIAAAAERCEMCLDTGHLAYAGLDPAAVYDRHAERVPYVHLKDLDRTRRRGGYWASVAAGVFRPLGEGTVDLKAFLARLGDDEGVAVIEQDRVPGGDPVADLRRSRAYVEAVLACRA
jgi:inosose dehydratase